ncbi:hypothetical protein BD780_002450 [Clostridium tetanomorphum]|nr:hypothetical protein [Clostridium tetanomorphum]NRS85225.1 hypothetical protein [Clostridium tetanomorphum]
MKNKEEKLNMEDKSIIDKFTSNKIQGEINT